MLSRFPDGNPETMGLHTPNNTGWTAASAAASWLLGVAARTNFAPQAVQVLVPSAVGTDNHNYGDRSAAYAVYPNYGNGLGGLCNAVPFTPNSSFWCNPRNARDGLRGDWNGSGGLTFNSSSLRGGLPGGQWEDASDATVHVWHDGGHWATQARRCCCCQAAAPAPPPPAAPSLLLTLRLSQMYGNVTQQASGLRWNSGGFQDARAGPAGAEWYVEGACMRACTLCCEFLE